MKKPCVSVLVLSAYPCGGETSHLLWAPPNLWPTESMSIISECLMPLSWEWFAIQQKITRKPSTPQPILASPYLNHCNFGSRHASHLLVSEFENIHLFMSSVSLSSLSAPWDNVFAIMHNTCRCSITNCWADNISCYRWICVFRKMIGTLYFP